MNLHLMIDNPYCEKFIEINNNSFDNSQHLFLVICTEKPKHIKKNDYKNVKIIFLPRGVKRYISREFIYILRKIIKSKKVFIHYLNDIFCNIVLVSSLIKKNIYNWILWGGDLYEYIDVELYDKETKDIMLNRNIHLKNKKKSIVKTFVRKMAIYKISNILTYIKGDYENVKKHFKTKAEMKPFFYIPPTDYKLIGKIDNLNKLPESYNFKKQYDYVVQIGNSGDPSNNHIGILKKLSQIESTNFCVMVVLSYGNKEYIEEVDKIGKELLGEKYKPIKEFLAPEIYANLLNQVDIAIMNHNRQQGVGNILSLLYMGKKVFLRNEVSTYQALIEKGLNIYSIENYLNNFEELFVYKEEDKFTNKRLIDQCFNEKEAISNYEDLYN